MLKIYENIDLLSTFRRRHVSVFCSFWPVRANDRPDRPDGPGHKARSFLLDPLWFIKRGWVAHGGTMWHRGQPQPFRIYQYPRGTWDDAAKEKTMGFLTWHGQWVCFPLFSCGFVTRLAWWNPPDIGPLDVRPVQSCALRGASLHRISRICCWRCLPIGTFGGKSFSVKSQQWVPAMMV